MEKLLRDKLEAVRELRSFTKEIMALSSKTEYDEVNSMLDERQRRIEKIDNINKDIDTIEKSSGSITESGEIRNLKNETREAIREIAEMDNLIRKNINDELKGVKNILNQPEASSGLVNIKA